MNEIGLLWFFVVSGSLAGEQRWLESLKTRIVYKSFLTCLKQNRFANLLERHFRLVEVGQQGNASLVAKESIVIALPSHILL